MFSSISEQTLRHTCDDGGGLILFPCIGYVIGQWVIGIRSTEESLDGKEDCPNLECWTPFVCNHQKKKAHSIHPQTRHQLKRSVHLKPWKPPVATATSFTHDNQLLFVEKPNSKQQRTITESGKPVCCPIKLAQANITSQAHPG